VAHVAVVEAHHTEAPGGEALAELHFPEHELHPDAHDQDQRLTVAELLVAELDLSVYTHFRHTGAS